MNRCGLGDAAFLPQALRHGGLELRRIRLTAIRAWDNPAGAIVIGEIRWPPERHEDRPGMVPPSLEPLNPQDAAASHYSIQIHILSESPPGSARFSTSLPLSQTLLDEIRNTLAYRWWRGIATHQQSGTRRATITLHLSTKPDEPLTPYQFEASVLPLLKKCATEFQQDGLLVMFDNPSTNFLVYCAAQDGLVMKGSPCLSGHPHPA